MRMNQDERRFDFHGLGLALKQAREVKGLYAKARRGEIKNFTGISAPFEAPLHPALTLDTSKLSLEESVNQLLDLILPKIQIKK